MRANFTPRTQEVLSLAKKLAIKFSHDQVLSEHILLSFIKIDSFVLPLIEHKLGTSFFSLEQTLINSLKSFPINEDSPKSVSFSTEVKSVINYSFKISTERDHSYVSVEHLLYAMLNDLESSALDYFIACDLDVINIQDTLEQILSKEIVSNPLDFMQEDISDISHPIPNNSTQASMLETYGINLNSLAKEGKYDFLSPNDTYIKQIEETVCRKTKSCVLLVGDAGVGKTALVEGLAKKITNFECSDYLVNKTIISMDLPAMIAGTKYRGQFEERIKAFIDEAAQNNHIILFIDEIHTIVGAGNSEGGLDAANILKPYISRGDITCIGSTTFEEYKKSIAKDGALRRRFYLVKIDEPSNSDCEKIISSLIPSYDSFHGVKYSNESVKEAIKLSNKFIHNKQLPDKAIDLLDQAGSYLKLKYYKKPKLAKQMEKAFATPDLDLKTKNTLYENYKSILNKWGSKKAKNPPIVTEKHVREILSSNLSIPIESLNETASNKLLNLEKRITKDVIGQPQALSVICDALFKTHCGLKDPNRPIGSFLFLGKTGVGKTITSKSLCKHYFGSDSKLIYFDMSEFSDATSVNKFSGSSPGYVGYEEGGLLTEKVKREPHSVLLFDEIEKAHPTVLHSLLQILEEGRMTDNFGEETCFKNTIIILTSNLGANLIDKKGSLGFLNTSNSNRDKIIEEAKNKISPELVNRFDGIVLFNNFSEKDLNKIINIELNKVKSKLKLKNISVKFNNSVKKYILKKTIEENLGGRPVRRIVQSEIEVLIAKNIILNDYTSMSIKYNIGELICEEFKTQSKKS